MRPLHLAADFGISLLLYKIAQERRRPVLGILGAALWFFNSITIRVWQVQQIDSIVICLAIWALYFAKSRPNLAGFLMGCSISMKLTTLFLVPLLVLMQVLERKFEHKTVQDQIKGSLHSLFFISIVPLVISFPFFLMDYQSFFMGSFTHGVSNPRFHPIGEHADVYYRIFTSKIPIIHIIYKKLLSQQILSTIIRFPLFLSFLGLFIAYLHYGFDKYLFASFIFASYLYLSPIVFVHYFIWPIGVILAAVISKGFVAQNNSICLKHDSHKATQLFERKNRYWNILFVLLLTIAGLLRYYYLLLIIEEAFTFKAFFCLASDLGIGSIIYQVTREKNRQPLGVFGAAFWLLNQATLYIYGLQSNISIGLFLAVLAIYILKIKPDLAKLILGTSIVFSPLMIVFTPPFLAGPGSSSKLFDNVKKRESNYLQIRQIFKSLFLLIIIPMGLFFVVKTNYQAFFKFFLPKIPYFTIVVFLCLLVSFYLHRNELDHFAYASLAAVLFFTFTADKWVYSSLFWFLFVILFIVGGDFTLTTPLPEQNT